MALHQRESRVCGWPTEGNLLHQGCKDTEGKQAPQHTWMFFNKEDSWRRRNWIWGFSHKPRGSSPAAPTHWVPLAPALPSCKPWGDSILPSLWGSGYRINSSSHHCPFPSSPTKATEKLDGRLQSSATSLFKPCSVMRSDRTEHFGRRATAPEIVILWADAEPRKSLPTAFG